MGKTIAVISALQEELQVLKDKLKWGEPYSIDNGLSVSECNEKGIRLVSAHAANKMGLTEAAVLATRMIIGIKPDLLVMIGICGGLKIKNVNIGDIIVTEKAYHYQFGSFQNGEIKRHIKSCEVDHSLYTKILDFLNNKKVQDIERAKPKYMERPETVLKRHGAPIASADYVVKDDKKLNEVNIPEYKVKAVDMESYAVLYAAKILGVKALVIKSISDFADEKKGEDDKFRNYCIYTASEAFYQFILYEFGSSTDDDESMEIKSERLTDKQDRPENKTVTNKSTNSKNELLKNVLKDMIAIPPGKVAIKTSDNKTIIVETFNKELLVGKYPVTQRLYEEVMNSNPSEFKGDNIPVHNVSWEEAIRFCNTLSLKTGLKEMYKIIDDTVDINYDIKGFRLLTEAEWEYSAAPEDYDKNKCDTFAWYNKTTVKSPQPHEVGLLHPNKYGLHDMLGNVWEWCNNYHAPLHEINSFKSIKPFNASQQRSKRGGAWTSFKNCITPDSRSSALPHKKHKTYGFRIILNDP